MDGKKKTILAVSLVALWAGLAVWQWRFLQEPVRVPLTNVSGYPSVGQSAQTEGKRLRVNHDLLAVAGLRRQEPLVVHRNIFAVPSAERPFPTEKDSSSSGNQPGSASAELSTRQEDGLELEQYRYLGFLRVGEKRRIKNDIAVLRKDDEVLVLKVGDRVDDHLILKAINSESVTIRNITTRLDHTVPLSEASSDAPTGPLDESIHQE